MTLPHRAYELDFVASGNPENGAWPCESAMEAGWPNGGQLPQSDFSGTGLVSDDSLVFGFDLSTDMGHGMTDGGPQDQQQWLPQHPYQAQQQIHAQQQPQQQQQQQFGHPDPTLTLDSFLQSNGGWRPPEPCNYCRKMRLQCFMLQTTEANPNPVTSCSSCVALFRQCSLAERAKRHHADYETGAPVIGQLHGVSEEAYENPPFHQQQQQYHPEQLQAYPTPTESRDLARAPSPESLQGLQNQAGSSQVGSLPGPAPGKRISARMVKRTRALRNWFAKHQEHPYPTDEEKIALADESGLSRVQVTNWFTNARRRQRQSVRATTKQDFFASGSPMPQKSPNDFSPIDRWRNSPPEEEAVDPSALKDALNDLREEDGSAPGTGRHARGRSTHHEFSSASGSQASSYNPNQPNWLEAQSTGSSAFSHQSQAGDVFGLVSPNEGYSSGDSGQHSGRQRSIAAAPLLTNPSSLSNNLPGLQCTFCRRTFKKKSDWVRHERTIHVPDLDSWICSLSLLDETQQSQVVWRLGHTDPECVFCGEKAPSPEHLRSHEFEACAERPVQERTFARKDHLWQHLKKFHGCKRWEGWSLDLNRLQISNDGVSSRCGFCGLVMTSWKARAQHVAAHFRTGLTMAQWTGDAGILSQ